MYRSSASKSARALFTFAVGFLAARGCIAQANTTASKSAEITAFGGYTALYPGFSHTVDSGGTIGLNYTRFLHFPVAPSIEVRATAANGTLVNQKSYLVGFRAVGDLNRRYKPYVDFMFGKGNIHYKTLNPAYNQFGLLGDASAVYGIGAGVDLDVTKNFALKIDLQGQHWRPEVSDTFYPAAVTVGVTYRIPFRRYVADRDIH